MKKQRKIGENGEGLGKKARKSVNFAHQDLLDILDDKTISQKTELSVEKVAELRRSAEK